MPGLIDFRVPPGSVDDELPLSALIYAAQGILFPMLSFNHVPDLLDILSQVECVREFSREHAKWALIWQRFYILSCFTLYLVLCLPAVACASYVDPR